jgi:hypothetical protein
MIMNIVVLINIILLVSKLASAKHTQTSTSNLNPNVKCKYNINYSASVDNILVIIAQNQGFFDAEKICVEYKQTNNSLVQQIRSLSNGEYNLINIAAEDVFLGSAITGNRSLSIVANIDRQSGFVIVGNTNNGINTLSDLANKPLAVTNIELGVFIFALLEIFNKSGVPINISKFQLFNTTEMIENAISNGSWFNPLKNQTELVYGTIFSGTQFYRTNIGPSVKIVAFAKDYFKSYQTQVIVGTFSWLSVNYNRNATEAFLIGIENARKFVSKRQNKKKIFNDLLKIGPIKISSRKINNFYFEITNRKTGLDPSCDIDIPALHGTITVVQNQLGSNSIFPPANLTDSRMGGFYDLEMCHKAIKEIHNRKKNKKLSC